MKSERYQQLRAHLANNKQDIVANGGYAKNEAGDICCDYCKQAITDKQILSIHHMVPARSINAWSTTEIFGALDLDFHVWEKFYPLDEDQRREFLIPYLNHANNLRPMHQSCHKTVDDGTMVTDEERAIIDTADSFARNEMKRQYALTKSPYGVRRPINLTPEARAALRNSGVDEGSDMPVISGPNRGPAR